MKNFKKYIYDYYTIMFKKKIIKNKNKNKNKNKKQKKKHKYYYYTINETYILYLSWLNIYKKLIYKQYPNE